MEKFTLSAKPREITGKKVKELREKGELPAVMYGTGKKPENLVVDKKEFEEMFARAGSSSIVELKTNEKEPTNVLIHDVQFHPVSDEPLHIDFLAVRMDKEIKTRIPLEFVGTSPAVAEQDGILVTPKDTVEVECLPKDLVAKIEADISSLKTFDDSIHIRDIAVPPGIKILDDGEETVALVNPPRSEEELKELEEKPIEEEKEALEKMEAETEAEKAEGGEAEVKAGEEEVGKKEPPKEK